RPASASFPRRICEASSRVTRCQRLDRRERSATRSSTSEETVRRSAEHLGEQVEHRSPRSLVRELVITDPGDTIQVSTWTGEAVAGAAVQIHPPIHPAGAHLLLERGSLRRRDERVLGADGNEHLPFDVGGVVWLAGGEAGMETHDRL